MFQRASHVRRPDKFGRVWDIERMDYDDAIVWNARMALVTGRYRASVRLRDGHLRQLPMALMEDVYVAPQMENRGVGSFLVGEIIAACKEQGHAGIEGKLSRVDRGHFGKLKHFYEKFGFAVTFYPWDYPRSSSSWLGEIKLVF